MIFTFKPFIMSNTNLSNIFTYIEQRLLKADKKVK